MSEIMTKFWKSEAIRLNKELENQTEQNINNHSSNLAVDRVTEKTGSAQKYKFYFKFGWNYAHPFEILGVHYEKDDNSFNIEEIDINYYFWITLLNFDFSIMIERRTE